VETLETLEMPTQSRFAILWLFAVLVFALPAEESQANERTVFALYVSTNSTWVPEVRALKEFLQIHGYSYEVVGPQEINSGLLNVQINGSVRPKFRALLMPGGLVGRRALEISESGRASIRNFIQSGGGYVGFCAGAAYATSQFLVALDSSRPDGMHRPSDYFVFPYKFLDLFPGTARSPYDWAPFSKGGVETIVDIEPLGESRPFTTKMIYFAGPSFDIDAVEVRNLPGLEVWARVQAPSHEQRQFDSSNSASGKASIIKFEFGRGNVVLFSQHPVLLFGGRISGVNLTENVLEEAHKVSRLERHMSESWFGPSDDSSNVANWNLVESALRQAAGLSLELKSPLGFKAKLRNRIAVLCENQFVSTN
jgi:glutamine amidotransferase-like uncharacterized protein